MAFRLSCGGCLNILTFAFIGLLLGGPRGMLIGGLVGLVWSWVSSYMSRRNRERMNRSGFLQDLLEQARRQREQQSKQLQALTGIFMAVVKQTDRARREIHRKMAHQVLSSYARQSGVSPSRLIRQFEDWDNRTIETEELAAQISEQFPRRALMNFIHDLGIVAFADGEFNQDEAGMIHYIGKKFRLDEATVDDLLERVRRRVDPSQRRSGGRTRRRGQSLDEAYEVLDLSREASESEVKKRYRNLVRKYHPDQLDADENIDREEAEEKMIEINRAYKAILNHLDGT